MPSRTSIILIASLAVNAALLGIVGGQMFGRKPASPPAMDYPRYGPASDVVMAAWDQLPAADRAELSNQFKERWRAIEGERKQLSAAGKAVYDAALAEPFEEQKLRDAVTIFQQREQRMQQSAEDILISHIGKMPPEARATAAVGLLTPFNARMQRVDGRGSPKREGEGRSGSPILPGGGTTPGAPAKPPARPN